MAGLGDVSDESDLQGNVRNESSSDSSSSTASTSDDSDDEFPLYVEETPFFAVVQTAKGTVARNKPPLSITYRQYSEDSQLKLWEVPDEIEKYWETDWMFKNDKYQYEQEYPEREFVPDLRSEPLVTLQRLKDAITVTGADPPEERSHTCDVCGDELHDYDAFERIFGRYVHDHHTVAELAEEGLTGRVRNENRLWD